MTTPLQQAMALLAPPPHSLAHPKGHPARMSTEQAISPPRPNASHHYRIGSLAVRFLSLVCGLVMIVSTHGCQNPDAIPNIASENSLNENPLRVEYDGCGGVERGPVCLIAEARPLTVWLSLPSEEVIARMDDQPMELPQGTPIQGGVRLEIPITPQNRELSFQARDGDNPWHLELAPQSSPPWRKQTFEHLSKGELEEAREELEAALAGTLPSGQRGEAMALFGQLLRQRGEIQRGEDVIRSSLPLLLEGGDLLQLFNQTTALVYFLTAQGFAFTEAREQLEGLPRDWQSPGEVSYYDAYYRSLLAATTGDHRSALAHLERAEQAAQRTGRAAYHRVAEEMIAVQLQRMGRRDEAAMSLQSLLTKARNAEDRCRQAGLLSNLGWNALQSHQTGDQAQDPIPFLSEALSLLEKDCPESIIERHNTLLNLALAKLQQGDSKGARQALTTADEIPRGPSLRLLLWRQDLEGQLALAEQQPREALRIYDGLEALAHSALAPEAVWRARIGLARARWALGELEQARKEFEASEDWLEGELFQVPLQEGRETFLAQRQEASREYLDLLLLLDRKEAAFALARRSRVRLLRHTFRALRLQGLSPTQRTRWESFVAQYQQERAAVEELAQQDWQFAADALQRLQEERQEGRKQLARLLDEVLALLEPNGQRKARQLEPLQLPERALALLFHPVREGWAVFVHSGQSPHSQPRVVIPPCSGKTPSADDRQLAACLLAAVEDHIRSVDEVHILATGHLRDVDFQSVALGETQLLDRARVIYDLDLGPATPRTEGLDSSSHQKPEFTSTLVLADATGDLPAARQEAKAIADLLSHSVKTRQLIGNDATISATTKALPGIDLLHFAGHASFAGRSGWQSFLPLAANSRLTLEDILLLEEPPRWVVLSGCETARTGEGSARENRAVAESLGLAQAFLVAGSEGVLAAVRPVGDTLAAEMSQAFYQAWAREGTPSEALRQAQLSLRNKYPESNWSSFRWIAR